MVHWYPTVSSLQIDPDERPTFEVAVHILEQTDQVLDDSASVEQAQEPDNMSCFSEPVLRLRDSDEDFSSASEGDLIAETRGRNYGQQLGSLGSGESFSSLGSSVVEEEDGGMEPGGRHGTSGAGVWTTISSGESKTMPRGLDGASRASALDENSGEVNGANLGELGYTECSGSRHTLVADDEINSNMVGGGGEREGHSGGVPEVDGPCRCLSMEQAENGDCTPRVCHSPALHRPCRKQEFGPSQGQGPDIQMYLPQQTVTPPNKKTPVMTAISDDTARCTAFVTPSGQCSSPVAHSMASSDFSFRLPTPSTPWAPPPSPLPSQIESRSLPASPSLTRRRFRFSQDVAPTSDIAAAFGTTLAPNVSNRYSTPSLEAVWHRIGLTMEPQEPVRLRKSGRLSRDGDTYHPVQSWKRVSLCTNLHDEHFSCMEPERMRRNRSDSSPLLVPRKVSNYSLTLARQASPLSGNTSRRTSGYYTSYNCYDIKLQKNYRLSSSVPDLLLFSRD